MFVTPENLDQLPQDLQRAVLEVQDYVTQVAVIHGEQYRDLAEFVLSQMGQFSTVNGLVFYLYKETNENTALQEQMDSFMSEILTQCANLTNSYVKAAKLNEETASKVFREARAVYDKLVEVASEYYGK